jgi:hypothetical protein
MGMAQHHERMAVFASDTICSNFSTN